MTDSLSQESLLDVDFAMLLWGDKAMFQRLLRLSLHSLNELPELAAVPALVGEEQKAAGRLLHKFAGRSGVVGLNRLAAAVRAVDHAIRADEPCGPATAELEVVLAETRQAAADYLGAHEVPYVRAVDAAAVDKTKLGGLIEVFERAVEGNAGTSEMDDALETLFDVVGEEPAWGVHGAANLGDMTQLRVAIEALKARYAL